MADYTPAFTLEVCLTDSIEYYMKYILQMDAIFADVIMLRYYMGIPIKLIAVMLRRTPQQVSKLIKRGEAQLAMLLRGGTNVCPVEVKTLVIEVISCPQYPLARMLVTA